MSEHVLKCWPVFFTPLANHSKNFEIRNNDRHFQVGDTLRLREWDPEIPPGYRAERGYTDRELRFTITYVLTDFAGITPGYAVLALAAAAPPTTGEGAS